MITVLTCGGDDAEAEVEASDLRGTPIGDEGNIREARDGLSCDTVFFEVGIEKGDGGIDDELVRDAVGSRDAVAMEEGLDLVRIRDAVIALVEVIAQSKGVVD